MAKKMAGYMYAIENGAKYIYETDTNLKISQNSLSEFIFENRPKYLVPRFIGSINPFTHFGQSNLHPNFDSKAQTNRLYRLKWCSKPVIQHSVYEGHPDIYRGNKLTLRSIKFDRRAPPFVLPTTSVAAIPSRNSLFSYNAFWSLFLPPSMNRGKADIFRSYWGQKLLSLGGCSTVFLPPNGARNIKSELINNTGSSLNEMARFLVDWNCYDAIDNCIAKLSQSLVDNGFWLKEDMKSFNDWIKYLHGIEYEFHYKCLVQEQSHAYSKRVDGKNFIFHPVEQQDHSTLHKITNNHEINRSTLKNICPHKSVEWLDKNVLEKVPPFEDITLIVHFNYKTTEIVLRMILLLYRPQFPNLIICGHIKNQPLMEKLNVTFIPSYKKYYILNSIDCHIIVMQMGYKVVGYLQTHDDNILHPWHMTQWDRDKIWYTPPHKYMCGAGDSITRMALYDNGTVYKNYSLPTWVISRDKDLKTIIPLYDKWQSLPTNSVRHRCYKNQLKRLRKNYRFDHSQADHFYVPKRLAPGFVEIVEDFMRHGFYFEIAIPTALKCIELPMDYVRIKFRHLYGHMRTNIYPYSQHLDYSYVHPFKLGALANNSVSKQLLICDSIIHNIYEKW